MHTFLVQVGQIEGSQKHPFVGANLACVYKILHFLGPGMHVGQNCQFGAYGNV